MRTPKQAMAAYAWPDSEPLLAELARETGVTVAELRSLRDAALARREGIDAARAASRTAISRRLKQLANQVQWRGSMAALLVRVLDAAIQRQAVRAMREGNDGE